MALIKCSECGREVSDKARTCPGCGAPIAASSAGEPRRKTGCFTWAVAIVIGLAVLSGILGQCSGETSPSSTASLTAEQAAAKVKDERLSSARGACLIVLKRSLNDPDSAKLDATSQWFTEEKADGTILVQPSGRAKNAFGAYIYGVWDCVTRSEGTDVRVLSLKQIKP